MHHLASWGWTSTGAGVRIWSNETNLPDDSYIIMLDHVPIVEGRISSDAKFSPSSASSLEAAGLRVAELEGANHPRSKQLGWWVPQNYWDRVQEVKSCSLWPDPMQFVAAQGGPKVPVDANVTATVGIGPRAEGGFGLEVALEIYLPGLARADAEALVQKAHHVCPYSNAARNSLNVRLNIV